MGFTPRYTHLFFDLDNTLWDFERNARQAMQLTVNDLGLAGQTGDPDTFYDHYEAINKRLWGAYRKREMAKSVLIRQRFEETLRDYRISTVDPVDMNEVYLDHMGRQNRLIDGAHEVLATLHRRGFHLHILTNGFTRVQNQKLHHADICHYFERVFTSEEIGFSKPDVRAFQHAIRSSNAKKSQSVMIGDDWEIDILGAKCFGIDQIYFQKNSISDDCGVIKSPQGVIFDSFSSYTPQIKTYCVNILTNILQLV